MLARALRNTFRISAGALITVLSVSLLGALPAGAVQDLSKVIPVGAAPTSVAFSPDGTRAYVTNTNDDTVSVIDTAIAAVIDTVVVGDEPGALAVSPSGTEVYVANWFDNTVSVIGVDVAHDTYAVADTISVGTHPVGVTFGRDGLKAYAVNNEENTAPTMYGTVSVIDVGTRTVTNTLSTPLGILQVSIIGGTSVVTQSVFNQTIC